MRNKCISLVKASFSLFVDVFFYFGEKSFYEKLGYLDCKPWKKINVAYTAN
jgi:hypothetical protein